tara:strand:- start:58 stop:564 length:507 start_codon:yes stop_codon:yes gene_type:complete
MKIPKNIEFHNQTNIVLSRFLKAKEPEEGCAILIGQKKTSTTDCKTIFWEIKHIWKCCNIWGQPQSKLADQNIRKFLDQKELQLSKNNRFEIDPKDQIAAQKWSRKHGLEVLCCAHSHPMGPNRPSEIDLCWNSDPGIMVISNKNGELKAWWIKNKFNFHRVKIEFFL